MESIAAEVISQRMEEIFIQNHAKGCIKTPPAQVLFEGIRPQVERFAKGYANAIYGTSFLTRRDLKSAWFEKSILNVLNDFEKVHHMVDSVTTV